MLELKELLKTAKSFKDDLKELNILLGMDVVKSSLEEYEVMSEDPEFWTDLEKMKILNILRQKVERVESLSDSIENVIDFITISILEEDDNMYDSLVQECERIKNKIDEMKQQNADIYDIRQLVCNSENKYYV